MDEPSVIPPRGGEVVGDAPDRRVEILSDHDALHVTWSRFGPRREGADLHVHHRHTDLFYVLEGELTVRLGTEGEGVRVRPGTLARLPPLVVHGFRNAGDVDVVYLNLHAPGRGFTTFMRGLRDGRPVAYDQEPPPPDGARPTTEAIFGGTGFRVDRPGLRVELLADVAEVGICEASMEPGSAPPPSHVHRRHVESLYVLSGELQVTAGDRLLRVAAGSWLQVPPGVPHTMGPAGSEPVRVLDVHAPSCGFGAFLRALPDTGHDEELAAARAAFDQQGAP